MRNSLLTAALLLTIPLLAADRRAEDDALARQLRASHAKTTGARVIVWAPGDWSPEQRDALTSRLDGMVARVEAMLGRRIQAAGYRQAQIEFFISADDAVPSHVRAGYDHDPATDPPVVFLSGLDSGEAPHIHETTHIVAGSFGSLLLREGLATYVQYTLEPGKMRPLVKLGDVTDIASLDTAVATLLTPPRPRTRARSWLEEPTRRVSFESRPERGMFYAVSASFVAFVVDGIGMEKFMRVYAADDARVALEKESGRSWSSWTNAWLAKVAPDAPAEQ